MGRASIRWAWHTAVVVALLVPIGSSVTGARAEHIRARVLVLDFDPYIDTIPLTASRGWSDPFALDAQYRADLATASGGIVDQRIVRTIVVREFPVKPGGFQFTEAGYLACLPDDRAKICEALIDYPAVLNTSYDDRLGSACQALARRRIDEVWLWGGPWFGYAEYQVIDPGTACPDVAVPFVVMGFNYERTIHDMLHDFGHRAEALVQQGIGFELWDRFDGQRERYGQDFACPDVPDATHPDVDAAMAHAGNVHFPPNAYCHYQYDRDVTVLSDANDWANFPDLTGAQTPIDSGVWGGDERGFLMWWLSRFPHGPGESDGVLLDWWRYLFPAARQ